MGSWWQGSEQRSCVPLVVLVGWDVLLVLDVVGRGWQDILVSGHWRHFEVGIELKVVARQRSVVARGRGRVGAKCRQCCGGVIIGSIGRILVV